VHHQSVWLWAAAGIACQWSLEGACAALSNCSLPAAAPHARSRTRDGGGEGRCVRVPCSAGGARVHHQSVWPWAAAGIACQWSLEGACAALSNCSLPAAAPRLAPLMCSVTDGDGGGRWQAAHIWCRCTEDRRSPWRWTAEFRESCARRA
jgi:hypothetical protein